MASITQSLVITAWTPKDASSTSVRKDTKKNRARRLQSISQKPETRKQAGQSTLQLATMSSAAQGSSSGQRSRRPHNKSRTGCYTCKQRRIKCDEVKPVCEQCKSSLRKCSYTPPDRTEEQSPLALSSAESSSSAVSLGFGGYQLSGLSPSIWTGVGPSRLPSPRSSSHGASSHSSQNSGRDHTDEDLYQHFVTHTWKASPRSQSDQDALRNGLTRVAADSEAVSHSIIALGAACLCCDALAEGGSDVRYVRRTLSLGLRHHTKSLEMMREMVARPDPSNMDPLLADSALLIPFAFAFQQLNTWVANHSGQEQHEMFVVAPRDAIVLLRGLTSTIKALSDTPSQIAQPFSLAGSAHLSRSWSALDHLFPDEALHGHADARWDEVPPTIRSHGMQSILAATSESAFLSLQQRLETVAQDERELDAGRLVACLDAFDLLGRIRSAMFSPTGDCSAIPESEALVRELNPDSLLADIPGWLRTFATRWTVSAHREPLVRTILTFFSRSPQGYIDILLPLISEEMKASAFPGGATVTPTQTLALDLYAHCLVLMFLADNETWWLGDFPALALRTLIVWFGDPLRQYGRSPLEYGHQWWPATMLDVATQLRQWS